MKTNKTKEKNPEFDSIAQLLHAMRYDPVINRKLMNILKMDSYPRHIVLSNWLEQLRRNNAPENLTQSLSILFDENIAQKVLKMIS